MKGDIDMTKALLDRILRLVIASFIIMGIGTSLLTEAMAQEAKQSRTGRSGRGGRKAHDRLHRIGP